LQWVEQWQEGRMAMFFTTAQPTNKPLVPKVPLVATAAPPRSSHGAEILFEARPSPVRTAGHTNSATPVIFLFIGARNDDKNSLLRKLAMNN
jgi:hypothetical protein